MIVRIALVLLFFLVLALDWAALDDITTNRATTDFTLEWLWLAVSLPLLVGLIWAAWREWRQSRRQG
ncbi:MAG: hypothetical protein ACYC4L_20705 [Chloroflexota bacterium]